MKKEEIGKEYMIEVGEFNHVPIMLKKDDIRCMLTDIIDGDVSTYWCDSCRIKKEAKFPIPQEPEYEPEAETLANGALLNLNYRNPLKIMKMNTVKYMKLQSMS